MLQIDKPKPPSGYAAPESEVSSPEELYREAIAFLRRQYALIVFVLLSMLSLAAVYLFTTPPRYTGQAVLLIDTHRLNLLQEQNTVHVDMPVDTAMVDSQVEILKSENIALSVIKDLHLIDDPEFVGPSGGLLGTILELVGSIFESNEPPSEYALTRRALARFQHGLSIKRVGATYIIDIDYDSVNPDRAAQIANAVADAYVVDSLEAKYQATKRAGIWLQDRLKELRAQATAADRAVVEYKAKNNIVDTGGRLLDEQQLAELNSALIVARSQTAEAQARMDRVQDILQRERNVKIEDMATVTDSLHDDVITRLRQQYLDIAAREQDWAAKYGVNHLAVVNLRNQMQEIRQSIDSELRRIAETYKSDYAIAKSREDSLQRSLDQYIGQSNKTNEAAITLRNLDSTAQSYRALADNFLQNYMMSVQQESFPITESRLITKATPPLQKSHPRTFLVLAVASAGGLMLALGLGMLREFSDRVFRTSSQIENHLRTDCISVVPVIKRNKRQRTAESIPKSEDLSRVPRTIPRDHGILWHVIDEPFSRFTEAIRAIKVAGDLIEVSRTNKVIAITSSLPNEGKSTIATALAQLMAHSGSKVILIDGDLRNPWLSRLLAPDAALGLMELISEKAALADVTWTALASNLKFLPVVTKSRIAHSNEILASAATKKLVDRLRESYDYIIVDLSPLAPVVDVRATTNFVDSYVFVVEWGRTKIDVIEHALSAARSVYDNLLGVVLNKADIRVLSRYESYRGKYYYNRYYNRYGYVD
jgi:polysaccharide biosynthesis transport protein